MAEVEPFVERAREVLVGRSPLGREDTFLFDHSMRVMRLALKIADFEDLSDRRVDRLCLTAAALFHQAATVRLEEERRTSTVYAAATMTAEEVKDYSAELAGDRLKDLLSPRQIDYVQEIIRQTHNAGTELAEAIILSDADNIDDIGALGVWRSLRRMLLEGYGIGEAIASWEHRQQYGYWTARLRDSLRLSGSRRLAEPRLAAARAFMQQLAREHEVKDLPSK